MPAQDNVPNKQGNGPSFPTSLKSKCNFLTCHPDNERAIVHTEWDEPSLFPMPHMPIPDQRYTQANSDFPISNWPG